MEIAKVYPLDAVYDTPEDVPEDVKTNKRYAGASNWTVKEVAETVKNDFGSIDILVHSLANGPEVSLSSNLYSSYCHCHIRII
jgi:enoyl-[acyl-carrier protein] reductase I